MVLVNHVDLAIARAAVLKHSPTIWRLDVVSFERWWTILASVGGNASLSLLFASFLLVLLEKQEFV